jgi:hypothetical protein
MATATKSRSTKKSAPAKVVEPEVEDDDLEELEEDEVEEAAPKAKKGAAQEVTFGVQDIVKYLTGKGHKVNARGLRTLIRKMARDGSNRVNREIVAGNRTRYDWPKGLKDPEVKKIIAAFEAGELEADKQEKLQALKERKAAKDKKAGKVKGKKAKVEVVEEDDDEDLELEDDE